MKNLGRWTVLVTLLLLIHGGSIGQDNREIESLIEDIAIDGGPIAMSGYSYEMEFTRIKRSFIGRSKLRRKYKAVLPTRIPKGKLFRHPLLLVFDSTRNLAAVDIIAERKKIIERLDAVDQEALEKLDDFPDSENLDGYITLRADSNTVGEQALRIDLLELLRTARFSNLKHIEFEGRKTITLDFDPSSSPQFEKELFYLGEIEGTIFVDEADKRVVMVESYRVGYRKDYNSWSAEKKSEFRVLYFKQKRMPEGVWFPVHAELNFLEYPRDFNELAVKVEFSFDKYRQFATSVESLEIVPTDEPGIAASEVDGTSNN